MCVRQHQTSKLYGLVHCKMNTLHFFITPQLHNEAHVYRNLNGFILHSTTSEAVNSHCGYNDFSELRL